MLTSNRLFLLGSSLLCAAAFASCSDNTMTNTMVDMAGPTTGDMAMTPVPGAPTITDLNPLGVVNTGGSMLTITGTNFQAGATVTIGGAAATNVMVVSSKQITCTVPAKVATCGAAPIVVTNPDAKNVTSPVQFFYQSAMAMSFAAPMALTMAMTTRYVIAADVDGQKGPDLITVNSGAGNITVRLNTGNGTFGAAVVVSLGMVGDSPYSIKTALLNGDTYPDLVVLQNGTNRLKVRLGSANGTFTIPTGDPTYTVGADARDIAVGDVNGDGKVDVVAANVTSTSVSLLLGDGQGAFGTAQSISLGTGPVAIILADFNGDNKLDFATADRANNLGSVRLQGDATSFAGGSQVLQMNLPSDIVAADFSGDSKPDLALVNSGAGSVRVTINTGTGTFDPTLGSTPLLGGTPATTRSIAVGDFNLDGLQDIAVTSELDHNLSILLNNARSGGFLTKQDFTLGTTADPTQVAVADLNLDGIPDIVSTDQSNGGVTVLLSQCK